MNDKEMVNLASDFAKECHGGQKRWDGSSYFLHPLAVASKFTKPNLMAVGFLHDVIEDAFSSDTKAGSRHLREMGLPEDVIEAVCILTRHDGQEYDEYITLVAGNKLAREVKLADIQHNLDSLGMKKEHYNRRAKYKIAMLYLKKCIELEQAKRELEDYNERALEASEERELDG